MDQVEEIKNIKIDNRLKFGIDRDEENRDVMEFVKTGNQRIFEKIYQRRKSTIEYLAQKYCWLTEDAASEIRIVLVRTVNSYQNSKNKTDFNTFFYTSVKNHFSNIAKKRYRKKRTTLDGSDPMNKMVHIDSFFGEDEDTSMHEFISEEHDKTSENIDFQNLLIDLSHGNKYVMNIISEIYDMTKKEILKTESMIFNFSFPLISGDAVTDISAAIGLPEDSYSVVSSIINNSKIDSCISVNSKKILSYLEKNFLDNEQKVPKRGN